MVSSGQGMQPQELAAALARIRDEYEDDPEYQELRKIFPEDWPM